MHAVFERHRERNCGFKYERLLPYGEVRYSHFDNKAALLTQRSIKLI
jgi:hypothetical protein